MTSAVESLSYDASMVFWKAIMHIFFREIRPRCAFKIPRIGAGPVIFVGAPHSNQFIDPLLLSLEVYKETNRHVQFLAAAKSMKGTAVGVFAQLMNSIPVSRPSDSASPGTGRIWFSPDDPCLILGENTRFLAEFTPRMKIMLPKSLSLLVAEVTQVISDTRLKIKQEFWDERGKDTMFIKEKVAELEQKELKGFEFRRVPFVDHQETYHDVYRCLKNGGSVGIFPEGGSHDRSDLLPLKAGVSVMALGAMACDPNVRVKIVPVGLSYFHAHQFRSRAVINFGDAFDVPPEYVEMFMQGGARKREAVAKLLDLVYDGLKAVTIRAPDHDTLMLIQAIRRLYKSPDKHLTLDQVVELDGLLLEKYSHFKDEPKFQQLEKDILNYNRLVGDLGLRDHQIPKAREASWKTLGLFTYRVGLLLAWTSIALPGTILNGPMFILAFLISKKKAKAAYARSAVRIAGRDVIASSKVLVCLGSAPILYAFYASVATFMAIRINAPSRWRTLTPFLVLVVLPFMNYATLKFGDAEVDVFKSLRPLIVALVPGRRRSLLDQLKDIRIRLSEEVTGLINEVSPKLCK